MPRTFPLILLVLAQWLSAADVTLKEYATRRDQLRQALPDSVVVLWAYAPDAEFHDRNGFFQDPNFYYLSGWQQPQAAMILCSSCPEGERELFFLPKRNARREIYDGPMVAPGDRDAKQRTGFDLVLPEEQLEQRLAKALSHATQLYTLFDGHEDQLSRLAPLRTVKDVRASITALRLKKSAAELDLLQRAVDASIAAHLESWKVTKPGLSEYEVSAAMQKTYYALGCERNGYAPIVGSGPNSVILHYNQNRRRMDAGDVLLMDVGAECAMYTADITRTIPVNGKWTPRQKQIYDMVLAAQNAVLAAAKPGVMLKDLSQIARDALNKFGKGPADKPWAEYLPHGVSHHIGLDVHDPFDPTIPLAEGNVITVEPGLYIAAEKIGIRIEDMIVITKDGARLMTGALPREAGEIERRMKP